MYSTVIQLYIFFFKLFSLMYVCACVLSHVRLFAVAWTHQAPLSMEFSKQEYWSWLPYPTPGDLPNPGIKPASVPSPTLAGRSGRAHV